MAAGLLASVSVSVYEGLERPPEAGSDAYEYDSYAWNLAHGRGYRGISPDVKDADGRLLDHPTAYRVPGTSVFWASLYLLFGHRYSAIRVAQCLLHMLTILLIYGIGRRCFGEFVGLLSAGVYAIWPMALFYSSHLGSEPLYAFLFCLFVLLA